MKTLLVALIVAYIAYQVGFAAGVTETQSQVVAELHNTLVTDDAAIVPRQLLRDAAARIRELSAQCRRGDST
jgi:hypothetical protein